MTRAPQLPAVDGATGERRRDQSKTDRHAALPRNVEEGHERTTCPIAEVISSFLVPLAMGNDEHDGHSFKELTKFELRHSAFVPIGRAVDCLSPERTVGESWPMLETASKSEKLRVFISYSRDDIDFADQLVEALALHRYDVNIDRHEISGGEEWESRLGTLIREADTIIFLLTPSSVISERCAWEVDEAGRLSKRVIPIVPRPLNDAKPPQKLQALNYIFFYAEPKYPGAGFGSGLRKLVTALNTDLDWMREHTRYLQRATEWEAGGKPSNRLLSGVDIGLAKAWASQRPKDAAAPTGLHLDFIRASEEEEARRLSAEEQRLKQMADMQSARESALAQEKLALAQAESALNQAADAQAKRTRLRNIALVVVSALALVAAVLGWRAETQRRLTEEQRLLAEKRREVLDEVMESSMGSVFGIQIEKDRNQIAQTTEIRRTTEPEEWVKTVISQVEARLGPNDPTVATATANLALIYEVQGKLEQAESLLKKSLGILENASNANGPKVVALRAKLAALYQRQGRSSQAAELYKPAIASEVDTLDTAVALTNLAVLRFNEGRYSEAQPLLERSLAIREKALDANNPDVATALNNLAQLYQAQGKLTEAEPLLKRSLAIREKSLGPDHPDMAAALSNLALLYQDNGRLNESEALYKRSLSIFEKVLGPEHPEVAASLNNLAVLYQSEGKYAEAEPLLKRSLAIREKALGPDHPDMATALSNLAQLYQSQGRLELAEPLLKRSVAIREKAFGTMHPDVATALSNLGQLYVSQGRLPEAELMLSRSLKIREESLGPEAVAVATTLTAIADLFETKGELPNSERLLKRSLNILTKTLGPDHASVATVQKKLDALRERESGN